jgi:hypothetical protein
LVPLLIQQNYIDSSKNGIFRNPALDDSIKMEILSAAADAVSDIDMIGSKIRGQDQHWELLPAQAAFSVKVGCHIQGFQPFPSFPAWLGKYSATSRKYRLTKEIVHHTALSIGQVCSSKSLDIVKAFIHLSITSTMLNRASYRSDWITFLSYETVYCILCSPRAKMVWLK